MEDGRHKKSKVLDSREDALCLDTSRTKREQGILRTDEIGEEPVSINSVSPPETPMRSVPQSPFKEEEPSPLPPQNAEKREEVVGGGVTVKQEPGQPLKLSRSTSHKIVTRPPPLCDNCPDRTKEAQGSFQLISECSYTSKHIGSTEHDSMDCDCAEEWDSYTKTNSACGPDSDCINRATKMECVGDCGCGADCQNQRFQRQQYAAVTVIQTEKKGYGLRTNADLSPEEMIYEYIGEVIDEARFRRRMVQYDEEGIKHFYFMSLSKGEFVDATKKGNLDKWVVGDKLRMGIFAERKIQKGEELVFNYNVDRYGANPQPCYCGEPNCTGFIGGKTQTERSTKLSNTTIEALGIDDGDGWDTTVAKKPRRKKVGEEDEEYVNNVQLKSLDENGVTKVMATLMQCKEKWITVKLLGRIQQCDDERVRNRVVKMHGYQILNSTLALWKEDPNVVLQTFDILGKFPRLTRNKISDSKIENTVESLLTCEDQRVSSQAGAILKEWSSLEVAYRIPRKKREAIAISTAPAPEKATRFGRRDSREERKARSKSRSRSRSRSRSIDVPRGPAAPSGPRSNFPQRNSEYYSGPRTSFRVRSFTGLPPGWFPATDENGRTYYYDASGKTTWQRPTMAAAPPPPPPKPTSNNKALEDIINEITSAKASTPKDKQLPPLLGHVVNGNAKRESKGDSEKWRSFSEEKQKKLYENTLAPHIKHVMDKFKGKLPKDDLKRFAKEISKKLVNSDYKNHRVEDPTKVSYRQEKQIKKYVQEFFGKAVAKKKEHDRKKAERKGLEVDFGATVIKISVPGEAKAQDESDGDQIMAVSDDEYPGRKEDFATPVTPLDQLLIKDGLKRKRAVDDQAEISEDQSENATPNKRLKSESPPPPPPPPAADMPLEPLDYFDGDVDDSMVSCDSPTAGEGLTKSITLTASEGSQHPLTPAGFRDLPSMNGTASTANISANVAGEAHPPGSVDTPDVALVEVGSERTQAHDQRFPGQRSATRLQV